jgi:hypothetical protein
LRRIDARDTGGGRAVRSARTASQPRFNRYCERPCRTGGRPRRVVLARSIPVLTRPATAPADVGGLPSSSSTGACSEAATIESFQKRDRDRRKMQKRTEKDAKRKERAERRRDGTDAPAVPPLEASRRRMSRRPPRPRPALELRPVIREVVSRKTARSTSDRRRGPPWAGTTPGLALVHRRHGTEPDSTRAARDSSPCSRRWPIAPPRVATGPCGVDFSR